MLLTTTVTFSLVRNTLIAVHGALPQFQMPLSCRHPARLSAHSLRRWHSCLKAERPLQALSALSPSLTTVHVFGATWGIAVSIELLETLDCGDLDQAVLSLYLLLDL